MFTYSITVRWHGNMTHQLHCRLAIKLGSISLYVRLCVCSELVLFYSFQCNYSPVILLLLFIDMAHCKHIHMYVLIKIDSCYYCTVEETDVKIDRLEMINYMKQFCQLITICAVNLINYKTFK